MTERKIKKNENQNTELEKLSEEDLQEKLSEIKSLMIYKKKEIYSLLEKRSDLVREAGMIKKEIAKYREIISDFIQKSINIRKELEQYKISRASLAEEKRKLYNELRKISGKVKEGKDKILNKVMKLEWLQQTTPLPPDEELEIIDKITELEKKILILEKDEKLRSKFTETSFKINEILTKREKLIEELKNVNILIKEYKRKIRELFLNLTNKGKEIDKTKEALFKAIKEFALLKDEYNKIKEEIVKRKISVKMRISEKTVEVEKKLAKKAEEKFKRGEKIDFFELQALLKQKEKVD